MFEDWLMVVVHEQRTFIQNAVVRNIVFRFLVRATESTMPYGYVFLN